MQPVQEQYLLSTIQPSILWTSLENILLFLKEISALWPVLWLTISILPWCSTHSLPTIILCTEQLTFSHVYDSPCRSRFTVITPEVSTVLCTCRRMHLHASTWTYICLFMRTYIYISTPHLHTSWAGYEHSINIHMCVHRIGVRIS